MNDSQQIDADRRASTALGLRYGRIAGQVLALLLLILGLSALFKGAGVFETFKGAYFIAYKPLGLVAGSVCIRSHILPNAVPTVSNMGCAHNFAAPPVSLERAANSLSAPIISSKGPYDFSNAL